MKMRWFLPLILLVCSFSVSRVVRAEQIDQYDVLLSIQSDGSIQVQEEIYYDLGTTWHHGIVRSIPIAQSTWFGRRSIDLEINDIKRDGHDEAFTTKRNGRMADIQIGDANKTIKGKHRYTIVYTVDRVLNFDKKFAELYWNAIGTDWNVPIQAGSVRLSLPEKFLQDQLEFFCYQGTVDSTETCPISFDDNVIHAKTDKELIATAGMTILVHFPVIAVAQSTMVEKVFWWLWENWAVLIPFLLAPILLIVWFVVGRDAKGKGTVIAQYEPPKNVLPTLMGAITDTKVDLRDITGGIIWLAEQGYLTITRTEQKKLLTTATDYQLDLLKPVAEIPAGIEQQIAQAFFRSGNSLTLSGLKNDTAFAGRLSSVKSEAYKQLVLRKYYRNNPNTIRLLFGIAAVAVGGVLLTSAHGDVLHIVTAIISALLIFGFGMIMPAKTKLGAEMKEYILGFKLFLSVTDKDRFKFHNAPDKNPKQFMEYLPYAIALGVETQWSDQFRDITIQNPTWYHGGYTGAILATQFAHDLSQFSTQTQSSVRSASYSGTHSSGGVGGGFGGGGGHSW